MESNLKKVLGDLNKSKGVSCTAGDVGVGGSGSGRSGSIGSAEDSSNPIAKVCECLWNFFCVLILLLVRV